MLLSCAVRLPADLDRLFAEWFISPGQEKLEHLSSLPLTPRQLDSLAELPRRSGAPTGDFSTTLFDSTGTAYTLGVHTPASFQPDSLYPLIVYLHGGIGTTINTKGEKAFDMLLPLADSVPLLLASPSANRDCPWWAPSGIERILQAVRYMALHYPVDPGRVILAGVSDGATGCYAVANAAPGPFAGFIAISGFGGMLARLGITLVPSNLMQRPIYNVNAGKDRLYPVEYVEKFIEWLTSQGVDVTSRFYPEEEHGFNYRGKEWPALVHLLRTWRRPARDVISWTVVPSVPNRADNLLDWTPPHRLSASGPAWIRAHRNRDTLEIHSQGLASVDVFFPGNDRTTIFYRISGQNVRRAGARAQPVRAMLQRMQQQCNPLIAECTVFRLALD